MDLPPFISKASRGYLKFPCSVYFRKFCETELSPDENRRKVRSTVQTQGAITMIAFDIKRLFWSQVVWSQGLTDGTPQVLPGASLPGDFPLNAAFFQSFVLF